VSHSTLVDSGFGKRLNKFEGLKLVETIGFVSRLFWVKLPLRNRGESGLGYSHREGQESVG
jgi:hypothetical protein